MDFVDNAGRHSLCNVATLIGDPRITPENGESITEAIERQEKEREIAGQRVNHEDIQLHAEDIELFRRSNFAWIPIDGHFRITVDSDRYIWVRKVDGGYTVWLCDRRDRTRTPLVNSVLDLGYAQGVVEDYIRANACNHLAVKGAFWRRKPATEKQLEVLSKMRIPFNVKSLTAGAASDLISLENARREASMMEPATPKQIWFIKNRLGLPVDIGITKGEASRIIAATKEAM